MEHGVNCLDLVGLFGLLLPAILCLDTPNEMMQRSSKLRFWFFVLLLISLAVRLAASFWWERHLPEGSQFGFGDSSSYWLLAQTIVRGEDYQHGASDGRIFRTPGYPIMLASLFAVVGDDPPVIYARALSAVLGVFAVALVIVLTWQLFGADVAIAAGMLATFYPGAVAMSMLVLAEAPFCPFMLLQLICWTAACKSDKPKRRVLWSVLGGVAAGAAVLVRPSWLLFTPFAIVVSLVLCGKRKEHLLIGTAMMLGLVLAMTPWWIRNYNVAGRVVPTTLQVGASLYDGLNPQADGGSNMYFVDPSRRKLVEMDSLSTAKPTEPFEVRLDRQLRDDAVAWARVNPGRVLQLMAIKFLRMWNPLPNAAELQNWPARLVVMLGYVPLMVLGMCGLWKFGSLGWPYLLVFLPAVYFTLLHVIFVSSIRYRQPAMLPIIVLAAGILYHLFCRGKEQNVY